MTTTTTRRVLYLPAPRPTEDQAEMVEFLQLSDDNPQLLETTARITYADWVELGEPEMITVTIEPGDSLNDPPDPGQPENQRRRRYEH